MNQTVGSREGGLLVVFVFSFYGTLPAQFTPQLVMQPAVRRGLRCSGDRLWTWVLDKESPEMSSACEGI